MDPYNITYLVLGTLFIVSLSYFIFYSRHLESQLEEKAGQIFDAKKAVTDLRDELDTSRNRISDLETDAQLLEQTLRGERENLDSLKAQFE